MNPCEHYEELLSARLDGELTGEEAARLEAHLETCPHCRKLAEELEEMQNALRDLTETPPETLRNTVLAGAVLPTRKIRKRWVGTACAAVLALVVLGHTYLTLPPLSDPAEAQSEAAAAEDMQEESNAVQEDCTALLTGEEARSILEVYLQNEGTAGSLTDCTLSENEAYWVFSGVDTADGSPLIFQVSRLDGRVASVSKGQESGN